MSLSEKTEKPESFLRSPQSPSVLVTPQVHETQCSLQGDSIEALGLHEQTCQIKA